MRAVALADDAGAVVTTGGLGELPFCARALRAPSKSTSAATTMSR